MCIRDSYGPGSDGITDYTDGDTDYDPGNDDDNDGDSGYDDDDSDDDSDDDNDPDDDCLLYTSSWFSGEKVCNGPFS